MSPALATFGTNGTARVHGGGGGGGTECGASSAGQDGHQTDNTKASGGAGELSGSNGGAGGLCAGNSCATVRRRAPTERTARMVEAAPAAAADGCASSPERSRSPVAFSACL